MEALKYGALAVFSLVLLGLFIAALVELFRHKDEFKLFAYYGLFLAILLTAVDFIVQAVSGLSLLNLILIPIVLGRTYMYVTLGIYCCCLLGIQSVPLIRRLIEHREVPGFSLLYTLLPAFGLAAGGAVFTVILFRIVPPSIPSLLQSMAGYQGQATEALRPSLSGILLSIEVAINEEIIFRLAMQNYLSLKLKWFGKRYWLAILITALVWTLGHAGSLDPAWVKLLQVFPFGIGLGYLFRKRGVGSCILAHIAFNVVLTFLAPQLIRG